MTTPNNDSIKDDKSYRKFLKNNIGIQGYSEEQYAAWLEKQKDSNPGANPTNPWIVQERKKEREI